jgi:hypothetical protein
MTSADRNNDLVPAQEKLEWVTPKISLMGAGDTDGRKAFYKYVESTIINPVGPS